MALFDNVKFGRVNYFHMGLPEVYMGITRSPLPQNNGNLPLPFFGGNYPIFILDSVY